MSELSIRDAETADLDALTAIKAPVALHRDRIRDADGTHHRYLTLWRGETLAGFSLLVFRRHPSWPDAKDSKHLPEIVDLVVAPEERGRGSGSWFVRAMEEICRERGEARLHLGVDPVDNRPALRFYERLGYRFVEDAPEKVSWRFTDSDGGVHAATYWNQHMAKDLSEAG